MSLQHSFLNVYFRNMHFSPPVEQFVQILPVGELWQDVSSSLLNGFINIFCEGSGPIAAALVHYDKGSDEPLQNIQNFQYAEGLGPLRTFEVFTRKDTVLNLMRTTDLHLRSSTPLSIFEDGVMVLYKSTGTVDWGPIYWFFWYDPDTTKCVIGRFTSEAPEPNILADFYAFADDISIRHQEEGASRLPQSLFRGWIAY